MGNGDCADLIGANSQNHANSHTLDGQEDFFIESILEKRKKNN